jgi:hypothetical protein
LNSDPVRWGLWSHIGDGLRTPRAPIRILLAAVFIGAMTSSCGFDTDQFINDMNDQLEDEGEIYYDPNCPDSDGDGWCD